MLGGNNMDKILILEDEIGIRSFVSINLKREGYDVIEAGTGSEAIEKLNSEPNITIALLDIMLPDMSGVDVCRYIREKYENMGIIMLTAKAQEDDKIEGFVAGADDYMIKPFDSKELIARIKAVIRRYNSSIISLPHPGSNSEYVEYPELVVNMTNYSVTYHGNNVEMPPKELELLYFLSSHPNQVFTREQLLDNIWGYEYIGDTRTVDVHIKRLREKIHDNQYWAISTVWGIGYKFEVKK